MNPCQTLKLANDLFPGLVSGSKLCTIRKGYRNIQLGPLVLEPAVPGVEPFVVDVCEVRIKRAVDITDEEARRDDALGAKELLATIRRFYPDLADDDPVTIIFWGARN